MLVDADPPLEATDGDGFDVAGTGGRVLAAEASGDCFGSSGTSTRARQAGQWTRLPLNSAGARSFLAHPGQVISCDTGSLPRTCE
jgi:hypothetical protein